MALDERLRHELQEAGQPGDPSGVYEELIRRRERRRISHRVQTVALAVVVVLGSIAGFYALTRIFRSSNAPNVAAPPIANGVIVFSNHLEGEGGALMSVLPNGTGLQRLTPQGRADYGSPDVSPDGRTVVVVHRVPGFDKDLAVLATVPIEGGSPTRLMDQPGLILDPAWSPDGERIAFAGSPGGPYGIYILDIATGESQLVPQTDAIAVGDPTWSPDGTHLAFEGWDGSQPERWDIYSVRLDGLEMTNITRTPDVSETWPRWSWANGRIAFVRGGGEPGLYTIAPDGTDEALVFAGLPDLANPAWSPDGTRLAFSADSGQVYTIPANGGEPIPVTGALGEPAWQPLPKGQTVAPTPSLTASPVPGREDIGLGFPVCNVSSIDGHFLFPDETATVFVATKAGDTGECPAPEDAFNVVALDVDRDGIADQSFGPIECKLDCRAFSAPDIDGDGTDELLVVQDGGAVVGLRLYEVIEANGETSIAPVDVAGPGDPRGGFEAGKQASFLLGGDEFELYTLQCGDREAPHGPGIVATSAESLPHDSLDASWHAHQTTLVLGDDALLHVVDNRDFTEPVTYDPSGPSFQSGERLCGSNLGPIAPMP